MTYNPKVDGVTQSILSGFLKCRQYSRLSLDGWTSMRTGAALQFGEMAHGVLESIYNQVKDGRKSPPNREEVYEEIQKQIEAWEASSRGGRADAEAVQQLEQNVALLEAVLPSYFKFWGAEDFQKVQWVALEQEFSLELFGVRIRGKIDGIFRNNVKALRMFETKTKGRIEEDQLVDLLAFDFQTDFYSLACQQLYGELPTGARYNIIRRPGEKLGKAESLKAYKERVTAKVMDDPKHYFVRFQINKAKKELELFKKELKMQIDEFVAWNEGKLPTYRNVTACMDRFGSCRFLKICSAQNYAGFFKRQNLFPELSVKKEKN